ncbi:MULTISPECIES: hypothetical protein [Kitasatospora]|uniref:hypothetical protein n=1 Tax=Kitasatospora TaxID=2063 RepID=UPI0011D1D56C|nr:MULTISPECIES: hypothetical protein [Kitasatospora]
MAVRAVFEAWSGDFAVLAGELERLRLPERCARLVASAAAALPVADPAAARAAGRLLAAQGRSLPAVAAGIALLGRFGTAADVPLLSLLGTANALHAPAVAALERLEEAAGPAGPDGRAAAVLHLTVRGERATVGPLLRVLRSADHRVRRKALLGLPADLPTVDPADARRILEAFDAAALLDAFPHDTLLVAATGRLLVRTAAACDPADLLACRAAPGLYARVVGRAGTLVPRFEHVALLLSLAHDLDSGTAALLPGHSPVRRSALLAELGRVLAEPAWTAVVAAIGRRPGAAARTGWVRRAGHRLFEAPAPAGRFRIAVVEPDPARPGRSEARLLVDGLPLVPRLFPHGPTLGPAELLDGGPPSGGGPLRASREPQAVRLAEASCGEACCGALWVTVRRVAGEVRWSDFRHHEHAAPLPGVAALRFDARDYDAELARAGRHDDDGGDRLGGGGPGRGVPAAGAGPVADPGGGAVHGDGVGARRDPRPALGPPGHPAPLPDR